MTTMVDNYRPPQYMQLPHRKPLPQPGTAGASHDSAGHLVPDHQQSMHSRTRTSSSSVFPQQYQQQFQQGSRRTLSNATASTTSTNASGGQGMIRTNSGLRRSSSSRSGNNSPTSYVSLMRKQKATVWCDRAQSEDPRIQAAQRAAKMRATMEVVGGNTTGRTSTSSSGVAAGVRSKIRHHGAPKASLYAPGNMAGSGVPMRLSASEVDENDSEDADSQKAGQPYHQRTGSGRSSLGSGRRIQYLNAQGRMSTSSTPPSNNSPADTLEEETPVPGNYAPKQADYFAQSTRTGLSGGSGSSGERENSFGNLGQMQQLPPRHAEEEKKGSDDLRRRGSVDDRTMTMSGAGRLFIANPDLSD
ncbi:uncharacterized protein BDZ99DRAFT_505855 [Mytilinidion resinicola]|uniref:Uncharacterized protein n=1 Tax=Mytilinidion resinicola TaxID=574789 RepID=A0A6A6Z8A6_9PEZI|nr:uncharacterized protein BDZ99DRAFT_505855 [Mytilinidion resinicola]KAF2816427.1 hypothetical protein BDZ99DRAFT_505855 [Mytilinidion resinicola]